MKTILITGATSGIGKALALHAASRSYKVIACGRNQEALNSLKDDPNIDTVQFDVTSLEETREAFASLHFDIAVLNAGTCEYVDIDSFESDMFRRVFEPNFFGVVHCVEAMLPRLQKGNKVVIVDSMARLLPFTRSQAYGASKAALHYFAKSLEVDLHSQGIEVQSISPGFVETPLTDKNDFEMPMKVSAEDAAIAMLKGIESNSSSIFFPRIFGFILRFMHSLPTPIQKRLSLAMTDNKKEK